jgi:hypothetical protein
MEMVAHGSEDYDDCHDDDDDENDGEAICYHYHENHSALVMNPRGQIIIDDDAFVVPLKVFPQIKSKEHTENNLRFYACYAAVI